MDSQGPSLSKGLPELETGASDQEISQNSNGRKKCTVCLAIKRMLM